ncbi:hypothetical protein MRB53_038293 [Persea americana]|nr:hypothetical protein MRB53_038293 [Persea americana]
MCENMCEKRSDGQLALPRHDSLGVACSAYLSRHGAGMEGAWDWEWYACVVNAPAADASITLRFESALGRSGERRAADDDQHAACRRTKAFPRVMC